MHLFTIIIKQQKIKKNDIYLKKNYPGSVIFCPELLLEED